MKTLLLTFLFFTHLPLFGQLEIPYFEEYDSITKHTAYTLSYNPILKQANWVAYLLTRLETDNTFTRSNKFKEDPLVPGTNFSKDYYKSGYDRGHLAPAADMGFSLVSMQESFYYTNMSPQVPSFNRGIWNKLENQVRNWAVEYDSLYVVTGPILDTAMSIIGPHRISVPNAYYKVLLQKRNNKWEGIGFILKNEVSKSPLATFVVSIDSIETITGLDFYPLLNDSLEVNIENKVCIECWKL